MPAQENALPYWVTPMGFDMLFTPSKPVLCVIGPESSVSPDLRCSLG